MPRTETRSVGRCPALCIQLCAQVVSTATTRGWKGRGGEEYRRGGRTSQQAHSASSPQAPTIAGTLFPRICYVLIGLHVIPESITWQEHGINVVGLDQTGTSNPPI